MLLVQLLLKFWYNYSYDIVGTIASIMLLVQCSNNIGTIAPITLLVQYVASIMLLVLVGIIHNTRIIILAET